MHGNGQAAGTAAALAIADKTPVAELDPNSSKHGSSTAACSYDRHRHAQISDIPRWLAAGALAVGIGGQLARPVDNSDDHRVLLATAQAVQAQNMRFSEVSER